MDYSYLEAKRALDDRSINRPVWEAFRKRAVDLAGSGRSDGMRLLEIGAGSGSMVERLASWGVLGELSRRGPVHYVTVEPQEPHIPVLRRRLARREELSGWETFHGTGDEYLAALSVDSGDGASEGGDRRADIVIAHAVLDLFSAEEAAALARGLLRPGGLLYATITFDGESFFEPDEEPELDRRVRDAYHESMARRGKIGAGFGRKLLTVLPREGMSVIEAGSSDWILMPREGSYPEKEGEFLKAILSMVDGAVEQQIEEEERKRWLTRRLEQLSRGELVYIAHQLDILARKGEQS